jgi:hypothetical protein
MISSILSSARWLGKRSFMTSFKKNLTSQKPGGTGINIS